MNTNRPLDPRLYQIAILSLLLSYGIGVLRFDVALGQCGVIILTALAAQYGFSKGYGLVVFDARSALISSLSLCLLLRTHSLGLASVAAFIAIASKFLIRWRGKHLFNPTNIALVVLLLGSDAVWITPGQWGQTVFFGFLVGCLGLLVVTRARRSDTTLAFLAAYAALLLGRALCLGDPLTIPLHQLQNGALLIFAFFMISDPKTTPDAPWARIAFACAVAGVAWYIRFHLYQPNALLYALAGCAPLVPVLDWLVPAERYRWSAPASGRSRTPRPSRLGRVTLALFRRN